MPEAPSPGTRPVGPGSRPVGPGNPPWVCGCPVPGVDRAAEPAGRDGFPVRTTFRRWPATTPAPVAYRSWTRSLRLVVPPDSSIHRSGADASDARAGSCRSLPAPGAPDGSRLWTPPNREPARSNTVVAVVSVENEVREFLSRPLTAHLATHGPHLRPVWFLWENDAFWILTGPWSTVRRDLGIDPRVALVVDTTNLATGETKQVVATGQGEILPWDPDRGWRMLRRYLGDDTDAWDDRFQAYLRGESGSVWLRLSASGPTLIDLSFVPSRSSADS